MAKAKLKMEPPNKCLLWHRWRLVKDTGLTKYHQCVDCGARIAQQPHGSGYQPMNMRWVLGLDDSL